MALGKVVRSPDPRDPCTCGHPCIWSAINRYQSAGILVSLAIGASASGSGSDRIGTYPEFEARLHHFAGPGFAQCTSLCTPMCAGDLVTARLCCDCSLRTRSSRLHSRSGIRSESGSELIGYPSAIRSELIRIDESGHPSDFGFGSDPMAPGLPNPMASNCCICRCIQHICKLSAPQDLIA